MDSCPKEVAPWIGDSNVLRPTQVEIDEQGGRSCRWTDKGTARCT